MLHRSAGCLRESNDSDYAGHDGGQHVQAAGLRQGSPSQGDCAVKVQLLLPIV